MASMMDISIVGYFKPIFVWIFIWATTFAILKKTELMGKNIGLNSLVAFIIATLFVLTEPMVQFIDVLTPWFVVLMVFAVLVVLTFLFLGVTEGEIGAAIKDPGVTWFIIILMVIVFLGVLTAVWGPMVQPTTASGEEGIMGDIVLIIFNPKVLGAFILLFIAAQAVRLIAHGF